MIGSLQITIPAGCMNDCPFCVYRQHATKFRTLWNKDHQRWKSDMAKRMRYAADRVAAVMLTSHGEPTINMRYIRDTMELLQEVSPELSHVEIQTSGVGLTKEKLDALYAFGVRVVSLSIPALEPKDIIDIMKIPKKYHYNPSILCKNIRESGYVLRLSVAMTKWFDKYSLNEILQNLATHWKPHQVSFKKIYGAEHLASSRYEEYAEGFKQNKEFSKLELLALNLWKYDALGMGIVWNDDCMVSEVQEDPRYLILQPDAKLYTRWDSKASVIF